MGTKFSDQLIDELLNGDVEDPDAFISSKIGETKTKYGKYLGMPPSPEAAAESSEGETPAAEAEEPAEPVAAAVEVKKTTKKKPSAKDMADLLGLKMSPV
jgi:hypothetical protein